MSSLETDLLGKLEIPDNALWGIHSARARDNFIVSGLPFYPHFYKALAQVKLACLITNTKLGYISPDLSQVLHQALTEMIEGQWIKEFIIDPIQGGAGTSTNMAINEIATHRANQLLQQQGSTLQVDLYQHTNLHQSTNDVYPTAIHVAACYFLKELETELNKTLQTLQQKEKQFSSIIRMGRTELMPAVPLTLGQTFSAWAEAIGRDRWRMTKALERIRQVNLGGTAIGTGITAPKNYIFQVVDELRIITGLPLSRSENMVDGTQNHDQLAEAFSLVKIIAINLEKISHDIRTLHMLGELDVPAVQAGSSIMPGKINPVIPEMISLISKKIIGNELTASLCFAGGELELNAYLPLAGQLFFESCQLLTSGLERFNKHCLEGITAHDSHCLETLLKTPSATTLLVPYIGYEKAQEVASLMQLESLTLVETCTKLSILSEKEILALLKPEKIMELGSVSTISLPHSLKSVGDGQ